MAIELVLVAAALAVGTLLDIWTNDDEDGDEDSD